MELIFHRITYSALIILSLGIFTSVSFSALSHILLFPSGIYFFIKWLKNRDFEIKKSWWALLGVTVICWLSVISNWSDIETPLKNIFKTKYFIVALLSYFSFYYMKRDFLTDKKISWALNLFLIATTVATISGLVGVATGFNPLKMKDACHATRACGLYGMYMTYGYGISLFMILITGLLIKREKIVKWTPTWLLGSVWFINLLGLGMSLARGAWLGYFLAVPFLFLSTSKKKFFLTIAVGLGLVGTAYVSSEKVRDTFFNREASNHQRIAFYKTAWFAAKEKPLLGWGYKNFEKNVPALKVKYFQPWPEFGGHAHNNFLEHMASTGFLGMLALIIFCLLWLKEAYTIPLVFSFILSFLISGMVQYTFGDGENLFLILSIFSLAG